MNAKDFVSKMIAIEDRQRTLDYEEEGLIRQAGWVYSSAYPDCCWRWSKEFNGQIIQANSVSKASRTELDILSINNPEAWPDFEEY
jgi:hypothetical protein